MSVGQVSFTVGQTRLLRHATILHRCTIAWTRRLRLCNPPHVDFLVSVLTAPFWITVAEHGRHLLLLKARPSSSINLVAHMNVRFVISDALPDAQRDCPMHMACIHAALCVGETVDTRAF